MGAKKDYKHEDKCTFDKMGLSCSKDIPQSKPPKPKLNFSIPLEEVVNTWRTKIMYSGHPSQGPI